MFHSSHNVMSFNVYVRGGYYYYGFTMDYEAIGEFLYLNRLLVTIRIDQTLTFLLAIKFACNLKSMPLK